MGSVASKAAAGTEGSLTRGGGEIPHVPPPTALPTPEMAKVGDWKIDMTAQTSFY